MLSIEQGKYYLQRQENNPHLGEILEIFHFRGDDEEGMVLFSTLTSLNVFIFLKINKMTL